MLALIHGRYSRVLAGIPGRKNEADRWRAKAEEGWEEYEGGPTMAMMLGDEPGLKGAAIVDLRTGRLFVPITTPNDLA